MLFGNSSPSKPGNRRPLKSSPSSSPPRETSEDEFEDAELLEMLGSDSGSSFGLFDEKGRALPIEQSPAIKRIPCLSLIFEQVNARLRHREEEQEEERRTRQ